MYKERYSQGNLVYLFINNINIEIEYDQDNFPVYEKSYKPGHINQAEECYIQFDKNHNIIHWLDNHLEYWQIFEENNDSGFPDKLLAKVEKIKGK